MFSYGPLYVNVQQELTFNRTVRTQESGKSILTARLDDDDDDDDDDILSRPMIFDTNKIYIYAETEILTSQGMTNKVPI